MRWRWPLPILHPDTSASGDAVVRAADWLTRGGIVLLPTETFYGLAVNPRDASAVADLFDLKGRPGHVALPLIAASIEQVEALCGPLSGSARRLADRFWPGPLTQVLLPQSPLAPGVVGADGTIAIRVTAHAVARRLARLFGGPITATSANRSGEPPAVAVTDLPELTADARVLTLDAGPATGGQPSTIVDARVNPVRLVRDGAVPWTRVLESMH